MLKNLSEVNINCVEGRLLMAALAKLTTESQTDKTPDEVIQQCGDLASDMFKDAIPLPESKEYVRPGFEKELEGLINRHSKESGSNTPDYILVEYLNNCLNNFHNATRLRDNWYGGKRSVINDQAEKWETEKSNISSGDPVNPYKHIAELVSSIFHYGNFKAETANERELETTLKGVGLWPTTEEEIIKRQTVAQ